MSLSPVLVSSLLSQPFLVPVCHRFVPVTRNYVEGFLSCLFFVDSQFSMVDLRHLRSAKQGFAAEIYPEFLRLFGSHTR